MMDFQEISRLQFLYFQVIAELDLPIISHGVFSVGPKYGCTHHLTLKELGYNSKNNHQEIVERLENKDIGWAYADQSIFNPKLHNLMNLRKQIIKRPGYYNSRSVSETCIIKK